MLLSLTSGWLLWRRWLWLCTFTVLFLVSVIDASSPYAQSLANAAPSGVSPKPSRQWKIMISTTMGTGYQSIRIPLLGGNLELAVIYQRFALSYVQAEWGDFFIFHPDKYLGFLGTIYHEKTNFVYFGKVFPHKLGHTSFEFGAGTAQTELNTEHTNQRSSLWGISVRMTQNFYYKIAGFRVQIGFNHYFTSFGVYGSVGFVLGKLW